MSERHRREGIEWECMDVRDMHGLADRSVDLAFDKGTLDAMVHGSPWSPPDEVWENTGRYLREVGIAFLAESLVVRCLTASGSSSVEGYRRLSVHYVPSAPFCETVARRGQVVGFGYETAGRRGLFRLLWFRPSKVFAAFRIDLGLRRGLHQLLGKETGLTLSCLVRTVRLR